MVIHFVKHIKWYLAHLNGSFFESFSVDSVYLDYYNTVQAVCSEW